MEMLGSEGVGGSRTIVDNPLVSEKMKQFVPIVVILGLLVMPLSNVLVAAKKSAPATVLIMPLESTFRMKPFRESAM